MSIAEQLRQEGRQEGRLEGQVAVLEMQLRLKFGELSSETRQKITSASAETLNVWIQRVLSAESLDEVFN